ncbi:myo-inositol-1(or 4)-monophosphatase [Mariprofundus ferrinatatus]|uniref:Myo-inositol-1(Or 4)-monophosphatase n=1 Tax=Mariprofundus ferrinatatus TaxID=1921087 RepID=A0A2K8L710_9PROT|nr:inositol monophosphatase family protein [Mariprofundus ferrinatatus]ATX81641.1 myo-inositol-1(or 4)-monophosphatase [Mariprofundus ferrinatatus]
MRLEQMLNQISAILIRAGETIIMPAYESSVQAVSKTDGSIVTETDIACQIFIEKELAALDSSIGFLGEEMSRQEQLSCLNKEAAFWCLDPLDGTTNFAATFPGFAISLALIVDGHVVLACTHDPIRAETFTASVGNGALLNGKSIRCSEEENLANSVGYIDFKRLDHEIARRLATERSYRSQRNVGSCALEWAWLAAGRGQFIIHGGEKLWDFAAGSLLVSEAGGCVGDFHGAPLFPVSHLSSPILATCNAQLQRELKQQLTS